jgi:hypothetical protein
MASIVAAGGIDATTRAKAAQPHVEGVQQVCLGLLAALASAGEVHAVRAVSACVCAVLSSHF